MGPGFWKRQASLAFSLRFPSSVLTSLLSSDDLIFWLGSEQVRFGKSQNGCSDQDELPLSSDAKVIFRPVKQPRGCQAPNSDHVHVTGPPKQSHSTSPQNKTLSLSSPSESSPLTLFLSFSALFSFALHHGLLPRSKLPSYCQRERALNPARAEPRPIATSPDTPMAVCWGHPVGLKRV